MEGGIMATLTEDQRAIYRFLKELHKSAPNPVAIMVLHLLIDRLPADKQKEILFKTLTTPDTLLVQIQDPAVRESIESQHWILPEDPEVVKNQLQRAALNVLHSSHAMHNLAEIAYWAL